MRPEVRDSFVDALDEAFKRAGAGGYEEGVQQLLRWTEALSKIAESVRTKEHLTAVLDVLPDPNEEQYAIAFGKYWPELLTMSVADLAQMMMKDFGINRGGRPQVQRDTKLEIIREMSALITRGYSTSVAKRKAGLKFGVSQSYAEKTWQKRGEIQDGSEALTLGEAKVWFRSVLTREVEAVKLKPGAVPEEAPKHVNEVKLLDSEQLRGR
jgi:hypothetical protein